MCFIVCDFYRYSPAIDVWSMGCIMAELLTRKPLFKGKSEIELINKVRREKLRKVAAHSARGRRPPTSLLTASHGMALNPNGSSMLHV